MTAQAENFFLNYLERTGDRKLFKMHHYLGVYHDLIGHRRGENVRFLEIGIYKGGSMPMWQEFWGDDSQLTWLDIDPKCKDLELPGTTVEIGDQANWDFMLRVAKTHGPFDIIIDDGGHGMYQQRISFDALWPYLNNGGLYIIEDTHTSYWPGFGGGYKAPKSFMEYCKSLIDQMHSWYTDQDDIFPLSPWARQLGMISFYDSMIVIKKQHHDAPVSIASENGKMSASRAMLSVRDRKSIFDKAE